MEIQLNMKKVMKYLAILSFTMLISNTWAGEDSEDFNFFFCKNEASNTLISNECFKKEDDRLLALNKKYFERILELHQKNSTVTDKLKRARKAFMNQKDEFCSAEYEIWAEGSIRNIKYLYCSHYLTKQNTHFLWEFYLKTGEGDDRDSEFPNPN